MKTSPYQTFSCSGYEIDKIVLELQHALTLDSYLNFMPIDNQLGNKVYLLPSNANLNPKPFAHPIDVIVHAGRGPMERKAVVMDIRPFSKMDRTHGVQITNAVEEALARRRGLLHAIWSTSDAYLIQNVCSNVMSIYAAWVSESIAKRLDMNAITQLKIANIAAWWFWCQSNNKDDLNDKTRPRILKMIAEATRSSFDIVEEDLNDINYFDDVESFCEEVKERSDNPRVKHLDPGALIQLTSSGWIGTYSREIMSVCLEYPPYFCAVVYTALHDRGVRQAQFTKLVQRFAMRPELKGFKTSIDHLTAIGNEVTQTPISPYAGRY